MFDEYVVHEVAQDGIVGKIVYDPDPLNPRTEYDNLTTIYYSSNSYTLGDVNVNDPRGQLFDLLMTKDRRAGDILYEAEDRGRNIDAILRAHLAKYYVIRPLYAYIHSGITVSLGGFSDPWDSAQCGIVVCDLDDIRREWAGHGDVANHDFLVAQANEVIKAEVETFDQYLTGQVYGYKIETVDGYHLDSCWGFLGDQQYVMDEMTATFEHYVKEAQAHTVTDPLGMAILRPRAGHELLT